METLFADPNVERFLQVHTHNGVAWFNKEMFELMSDWLLVVGAWQELTAATVSGKRIQWTAIAAETAAMAAVYETWRAAEAASDYRVEVLLDHLENPAASKQRASAKGSARNGGGKKRDVKKSGSRPARRKKTGDD
jgi:hypothetical protein